MAKGKVITWTWGAVNGEGRRQKANGAWLGGKAGPGGTQLRSGGKEGAGTDGFTHSGLGLLVRVPAAAKGSNRLKAGSKVKPQPGWAWPSGPRRRPGLPRASLVRSRLGLLLPGKSHGRRSLVGCSPWGCEESDKTEGLHFHFHVLDKEMATHSSVLAWRIPGTREPGGLPSMGSHRVGHD